MYALRVLHVGAAESLPIFGPWLKANFEKKCQTDLHWSWLTIESRMGLVILVVAVWCCCTAQVKMAGDDLKYLTLSKSLCISHNEMNSQKTSRTETQNISCENVS